MFFLNSRVDYFVIDCEHLEEPFNIANVLADGFGEIGFVFLNPNPTSFEEFRMQRSFEFFKRTIIARNLGDNGVIELDHYLRGVKAASSRVLVTGCSERLSSANRFPMGTIFISDSPTLEDAKCGADCYADLERLGIMARTDMYGGHLAEFSLYPARTEILGSSGAAKKYFVSGSKFVSPFENYENIYILGRYFREGDVFRTQHHHTAFLKWFKNNYAKHPAELGKLLRRAVEHVVSAEECAGELLTWIPSKIGETQDRNKFLMELNTIPSSVAVQKLLEFTREVQPQKSLGSYRMKHDNVVDTMSCGYNLIGRTVILFDDIVTSGETFNEGARALLAAGADRVIPVCFAVTCHTTECFVSNPRCICGGELVLRFRKRDGNIFWGCANWSGKENHTTLDFKDGLSKSRDLLFRMDEDIGF